mgnify:FL=1
MFVSVFGIKTVRDRVRLPGRMLNKRTATSTGTEFHWAAVPPSGLGAVPTLILDRVTSSEETIALVTYGLPSEDVRPKGQKLRFPFRTHIPTKAVVGLLVFSVLVSSTVTAIVRPPFGIPCPYQRRRLTRIRNSDDLPPGRSEFFLVSFLT